MDLKNYALFTRHNLTTKLFVTKDDAVEKIQSFCDESLFYLPKNSLLNTKYNFSKAEFCEYNDLNG